MGVGVEGYGDGGVPEKFLHELGVDAPGQKQRGGGVAQVVEAYARGETCPLEERREAALTQVRGVYGRARLGGEDEPLVAVVIPGLLYLP